MDTSPFIRLPQELRDRIYSLVLCLGKVLIVKIPEQTPHIASAIQYRHILALTKTCKRIRIEALPIFYKENVFRFGALTVGRPEWNVAPFPHCIALFATRVMESHDPIVKRRLGQIRDSMLRQWLGQFGGQNVSYIRSLEFELDAFKLVHLNSFLRCLTTSSDLATVDIRGAFTLFPPDSPLCSATLMLSRSTDDLQADCRISLSVELYSDLDLDQALKLVGEEDRLQDGPFGQNDLPTLDIETKQLFWEHFPAHYSQSLAQSMLMDIFDNRESEMSPDGGMVDGPGSVRREKTRSMIRRVIDQKYSPYN